MPDPKPYIWQFDRRPWGTKADVATFSVGVYQWLPKTSGKGLKRSNAIRVAGYVAESAAVYAKADELCARLNKENVRVGAFPDWVQKQYSVPCPTAARKVTVRDRVTQFAREILEPELKRFGFRRSGRKLWRNDAKVCQVVDLTLSQWGTATAGRFYINMGVFWHEVEEILKNPSRRKMPPPEYQCTYRMDLGGATPEGRQKIWDIDLHTDLRSLGRDVLADLTHHGLPWLEFRSELKNTLDGVKYLRQVRPNTFSSLEMVSFWAMVVFLTMLGKPEKAKKELENHLNGGPTDAAALALAERLGIDLSDSGSEWAK